ncbi:MAG TPA: hypothetical protein VK694_01160 [Verrucomicrobiae bacterium]|nr:hypothetical protein [Verrucomicrobiae bacterium]
MQYIFRPLRQTYLLRIIPSLALFVKLVAARLIENREKRIMIPRYVHVEGMDLAGKTTVAASFARESSPWEVRRNALGPNNAIYHFADSLRRREAFDPEVLGVMYAAAILGDIRAFNKPEVNTIQESTILLRSLAIHRVRGTTGLMKLLESYLPLHPQFDASFVFTASVESRKARLNARLREAPWSSTEDLLILTDPDLFMAMEHELITLSREWFNSTVIDTSNLSPEEVLESVRNGLAS